ncbi:MAG: response regulator [Candidatus Hydrogenedentes bacterium]|nr:response regulator [Candidatus Hydrogenedentota bacterium]
MSVSVLVVDDSETVRAIIEKTMRMADVPLKELFTAADGQEALDVLKHNWIDLVLTDINMPVMSGVQLIEHMSADDDLKGIPIVVVSTEGSSTRIEELKAKGVRAYIRKPFTPEKFREVFIELLGVNDEH